MSHALATVAALGFPDLPAPTLLPLYRELGCTRAQVYRNPAATIGAAEAARICRDAGLQVDSIHGVFGEAHDPSSPDPAKRAAAINTYRSEADYCHALGGTAVILHPAPGKPGLSPVSPDEHAARCTALRDTLEALALIAQQRQITIAVENMPPYHPLGYDVAELAAIVRSIGSAHIQCCFDAGHALMAPDAAAAPRDPAAQFQAMQDLVTYIHIHDNDGHGDTHLMPFDGILPWSALAAAWNSPKIAVAQTSLMLEVFYPPDLLREKLAAGWKEKLAPLLGN